MPDYFHPTVATWFRRHFSQPTGVQEQAWPAIQSGRHALIAAPTGSGKTLAAFLSAINDLVEEGLKTPLQQETRVLYVSPLKALSNDIQKNLQQPLLGIRDELLMQGLPDVSIQAMVRSGDTPAAERERMRRQPPHILVTTPESLYLLLTSEGGREMLRTVRSMIVDEIHAIAGSKRGSHLMLSLERLENLCDKSPVRIGLSATQKPIERMAAYLTGGEAAGRDCTIIDTGHIRERDIAMEVPNSPLEAVMANEVWSEVYDRLAALVGEHRTTLIFVNTRRLAERLARHLAERVGEEYVTSHHGSLSREHRLAAEQRLKQGELRALVATASLELGIDIGDVDLVCQLGSPRSIATFLQRVGRAGHAVGAIPKGRLFPLSRDDLVESAAMLDAVRHGELDQILIPDKPLDVLSQQIVAEVSAGEWDERELYDLFRRAWPYRELAWEEFTEVTRMLADGFSTRRGRRGAHIHRDAVNGMLRPRRGARLTALTNGGAIPDQFDAEVILQPEGLFIGTVNEDFAFESLPGDIFQLGNTSYRILKIEQGKVHVEDARGQPPNIPFWIGEAPGRTDELSLAVSRLRRALEQHLEAEDIESAANWLQQEFGLAAGAAHQLTGYMAAARAALTALPTFDTIILERFFDDVGDMHLVIHSPFGSRVNRAWGLAIRKRFCRKFNFELQAAALEDSVVLSLGPTHSFPLEEVVGYLKSKTAREILIQALLDAPMFEARWRWDATIALAVRRNRNGRRVPPQFQRSDAEDLVAVVFPDQLACLENISGDREVPDHPLIQQTLKDCLYETMDIEGLEKLLARIEAGEVRVIARDLTTPSPLSSEILSARPYAFLDGAPAEERRTLAVSSRRFFDPESAEDLGRLDPEAIARVRREAWPDARHADELHDALVILGFLTEREGQAGPINGEADTYGDNWPAFFDKLAEQGRVTRLQAVDSEPLWVAAEQLAEFLALYPQAACEPPLQPLLPSGDEAPIEREEALREIVRSRLDGLGPVTVRELSAPLGSSESDIQFALSSLEQEGYVIQGRFTPQAEDVEWCERRLLARIHRYTLNRLRSEIEPVAPADFMRFLFQWHGLDDRREGDEALLGVLAQLEGFSIPAAAWEAEVLAARLEAYTGDSLDRLCNSGRVVWMRLTPPASKGKSSTLRNTPIALLNRENFLHWRALAGVPEAGEVSGRAEKVVDTLKEYGPAFFVDLVQDTGLLRTQLEEALAELVSRGLVTADGFAGLRALAMPASKRAGYSRHGRRRAVVPGGIDAAGRWVLLRQRPGQPRQEWDDETLRHVAMTLLRRYGVVFRKVLEREHALPPWRDLLYVYRRMEARGEIRGGRFVQGFSGEQYALPEAVKALRDIRKREPEGRMMSLSAADPLNLVGIIIPGQRIPSQAANRILFRDGVPLAVQVGGKIRYLGEVAPESEWELRNLLVRQRR